MKKGKRLSIGLVCLIVLAIAGTAYAGTSYSNYSVDIPFLGSDYTSYQTKATTGASAYLVCSTVEAGKTLIGRMYDADGNAGDARNNITASWSGYIDGSNEHTSGESVRLRFAVQGGALQEITSTGKWKSN